MPNHRDYWPRLPKIVTSERRRACQATVEYELRSRRSRGLTLACALTITSLSATAAEQLIRNIAPPQYVHDAEEASRIMYSQVMPLTTPNLLDASGNVPVVPLDTFYLVVRHQAANAVDRNAVGQRVDYDAAPNTGLAVPLSNQRGPVGGTIAQSTYQLWGYAGGMLTLSWDFDGNVGETHPIRAWPCSGSANCAGVNKHAAYEMAFSRPPAVFTDPTDESTSLAIQGDLRVAQFDAYNRTVAGDGIPTKSPIGEYYFVLFYKDALVAAQPPIQQIVLAYRTLDSDTPYFGEDGINLEIVGASANPFVASSFTRGTESKLFNEVGPDSAGAFAQAPWEQRVFYRTHIRPRNLRNMIGAINYWLDDPGCRDNALPPSARTDCSRRALTNAAQWCLSKPDQGVYSCDLSRYRLTGVSLIQEIQYEEGDQAVMGSSFFGVGVFELKQQ